MWVILMVAMILPVQAAQSECDRAYRTLMNYELPLYEGTLEGLKRYPNQSELGLRRIQEDGFRYAGEVLKVADVCLKEGNLDRADKQYRHVISMFPEPSFAGYRQRAQVGVDDIRALRRPAPSR